MHGNTIEDEEKLIFTEFNPVKKKHAFIEKKYIFKEMFNESPKPIRNVKKEKFYYKLGSRQSEGV